MVGENTNDCGDRYSKGIPKIRVVVQDTVQVPTAQVAKVRYRHKYRLSHPDLACAFNLRNSTRLE